MGDGVKMKDIIWAIVSFVFSVLFVLIVFSIINAIPLESWVETDCPEWLIAVFAVIQKITSFIWRILSK